MKKKFLISFLAALAATTLALGFSACKTENSSGSFPKTPGSEEPSPTPQPTPDPYPETDFQYEVKDGFVTITKYLNKTATSVVIPKTIQGSPVTSIGASAFSYCSGLTEVYYKGDKTEWDKINISSRNEDLTSATIYYYSETKPAEAGNFWHYGANGEIVKW